MMHHFFCTKDNHGVYQNLTGMIMEFNQNMDN